MDRADRPGMRWTTTAGGLLLLLVLVPPLRKMTESSMTAHMLVQYPCLMLAGALVVQLIPARWLAAARRWNDMGLSGLVGSALALALLMIPRVLDLALADGRVEALKLAALLATGAALRLSWHRAGVMLQAFFLGNVLAMTAVVGMLYQDSAVRVCNAYRLDDQQDLGLALMLVAVGIGSFWAVRTARFRAPAEGSVRPASPAVEEL